MDHYADRLAAAIQRCATPAVVGIDPVLEKLPAELQPELGGLEEAATAIERFSCAIVEAVAGVVPAVKINSAFFEAFYEFGVAAFFRVIRFAHQQGLLVISDVKRGDIGSTAQLYARGHLASPAFADVAPERMPDAVTLAGYLGENAVRPFIDAARETGRGLYVLVRPSDPGADAVHEFGGPRPFYWHMAELVKHWGAGSELVGACGLSCVGAVIAPKDVATTRSLRIAMPQTPFLVPGYGAQGGAADACAACFRQSGDGAVLNASRSVIYAFAQDAYRERYGNDWQAAISAAAHSFASEARRMAAGELAGG